MNNIGASRSLLMMVLVMVPASAQAQDASPPSAEDRRLSAILLDRSAVAYRLGRYEEAIVMLEDAYVLSREPVLLYNLGRAYEGTSDRPHAIDAYRRYLETSGDTEVAASVRESVARLELELETERIAAEELAERTRLEAIRRVAEEALAEREARAARAAAEQALREEREREAAERRAIAPWPWTIAGVGAATIVAGAVVGAIAIERRDDAVRAETQEGAAGLLQEARDLATGANVAYVLGGVLVAGGVAWGTFELVREREDAGDEVRVELTPTASGVVIRGVF